MQELPTDLQYTALHEAAHAVVALAVGASVDYLELTAVAYGHTSLGHLTTSYEELAKNPNYEVLFEAEITSRFAGALVAERFGIGTVGIDHFRLTVPKDPLRVGIASDLKQVAELAKAKWGGARRRVEPALRRRLGRARTILNDPKYWKAVEAVADATLQLEGFPRRLRGEEICKIFVRVTGDSAPDR